MSMIKGHSIQISDRNDIIKQVSLLLLSNKPFDQYYQIWIADQLPGTIDRNKNIVTFKNKVESFVDSIIVSQKENNNKKNKSNNKNNNNDVGEEFVGFTFILIAQIDLFGMITSPARRKRKWSSYKAESIEKKLNSYKCDKISKSISQRLRTLSRSFVYSMLENDKLWIRVCIFGYSDNEYTCPPVYIKHYLNSQFFLITHSQKKTILDLIIASLKSIFGYSSINFDNTSELDLDTLEKIVMGEASSFSNTTSTTFIAPSTIENPLSTTPSLKKRDYSNITTSIARQQSPIAEKKQMILKSDQNFKNSQNFDLGLDLNVEKKLNNISNNNNNINNNNNNNNSNNKNKNKYSISSGKHDDNNVFKGETPNIKTRILEITIKSNFKSNSNNNDDDDDDDDDDENSKVPAIRMDIVFSGTNPTRGIDKLKSLGVIKESLSNNLESKICKQNKIIIDEFSEEEEEEEVVEKVEEEDEEEY